MPQIKHRRMRILLIRGCLTPLQVSCSNPVPACSRPLLYCDGNQPVTTDRCRVGPRPSLPTMRIAKSRSWK
ncbi:hypothetical protein BDV06DRAFT_187665 [Aspergillus oleicola]